ncbi:MAG TPA: BTAD domain-containing putative transcriptional regulator [Chloroflexota bacterium]
MAGEPLKLPPPYAPQVGETLAPVLRIYLTGPICVEWGQRLLGERQLPRRQGRLAFAFLIVERDHPVSLEELADVLWPKERPAAWESALRALVSKLRAALARVGAGRQLCIANAFGCYQLQLPPTAWVDLEVAKWNLHQAEGALLRGDPATAYVPGVVASTITRRPFLSGETAEWVVRRREEIRGILVRAVDCVIEASSVSGDTSLALKNAAEAVSLEPFREAAYQKLMRLHATAGNPVEALRVYARCREILAAELGIRPSPETELVRRQILQPRAR